MVVLGVDPHKKTHTVVAVDDAGRQLSTITVAATATGHLKFMRWAVRYRGCRWAVEDGRHVAGGLLRWLVGAGEQVTCVPTKFHGRGPGWSADSGQVRPDRCARGGPGRVA